MLEEYALCFGERRVQKATFSHLVSIPVEWVNLHKLEKGDAIEVFLTHEGNLLLTPKGGDC